MKKIFLSVAWFFIFNLFLYPSAFSAQKVVFGVLKDGTSKRFDIDISVFEDNIKKITGDSYHIVFPEKYNINCDFNIEKIKKKADFLLNEKSVEFIICTGPLGSHIMSSKKNLSKPVIAAVVVDWKLQSLPHSNTGSGRKNLNYTELLHSIFNAFDFMHKLKEFKHPGIVCDPLVAEVFGLGSQVTIPGFDNVKVSIIKACNLPEKTMANIKNDIDCLFITPLFRYSWTEFDDFISLLNERKIPSFSLWGEKEVIKGCSAGFNSSGKENMLAKRIGIQVGKILSGHLPEKLSTDFIQDLQMLINISECRKMGISPDWDAVFNSELVYSERDSSGDKGLMDFINLALENNPGIKAFRKEVLTGLREAKIAKSYLLPQINIMAEGMKRDESSAAGSFGQYPENEINLNLSLSQVLFDDEIFTMKYQADKQWNAKIYKERARELLLAEKTAKAFFSCLKASALKKVRQNDLELSRTNLKSAKIRKEIGVSGPGDVYRWRSKTAQSKKQFFDARSNEKKSFERLGYLTGKKSIDFFLKSPSPDSDIFLLTSKTFGKYFDSEKKVEYAKKILSEFAIKNSNELKAYTEAILAGEKYYEYCRRKNFIPKFYLKGGYKRRLQRSGSGSEDTVFNLAPGVPPFVIEAPENDAWQIGLEAVFPLFRGFRDSNSTLKAKDELSRLILLRKKSESQIKEAVCFLVEESVASWINISLSQESCNAAEKNLELVSDAYQSGLAATINLIDAQHSYVVSNEISKTSVYEYMENFYRLELILGCMDFSREKKSKARIIELFEEKMNE